MLIIHLVWMAYQSAKKLIDIAKNYALNIAQSHNSEEVYLLTNNINNQNTLILNNKELTIKINDIETRGNSKNINQIIEN